MLLTKKQKSKIVRLGYGIDTVHYNIYIKSIMVGRVLKHITSANHSNKAFFFISLTGHLSFVLFFMEKLGILKSCFKTTLRIRIGRKK